MGRFLREFRSYTKLDGGVVRFIDAIPRLSDATSVTPFDAHYFYMSSWAMRRIHEARPSLHVDIGGPVALIACVAAIVPTIFADYRPLEATASDLISVGSDLRYLPLQDGSVRSLSCLHVAEHVGLGRYGDPLDPLGTVKAAQELARVLAPSASLYFALPIGLPRVHFNAHRVHSPAAVIDMFPDLSLGEFSAVTDEGKYVEDVRPDALERARYACGLFHFVRR